MFRLIVRPAWRLASPAAAASVSFTSRRLISTVSIRRGGSGGAAASAVAAKPAGAVGSVVSNPAKLNFLSDSSEEVERSTVTAFEGKDRNDLSPMEYILAVPPIEVDGDKVMCNGGDDGLGHPTEFIQLNKVHADKPETCKYCGLRFIQKHGSSGGHH